MQSSRELFLCYDSTKSLFGIPFTLTNRIGRILVNVIDSDVLVIGGGSAGLRAAIEAREFPSLRVVIASKTLIPGGSSVMSGGHFNSPGLGPESGTVDNLFNDTIRIGQYLNNQRMVRICLEEVAERIMELERFGGMWPRQNKPDQYYIETRLFEARFRHYQVHNWYSWEAARALYEEATERGVEFYPEVMITSLQTLGGNVVGATGIDIKRGDFLVFKAKSTILATGGGSHLYKRAVCHRSLTGDGYAMALRVGAELANMEFLQWSCTGNVTPPELAATRSPVWFRRISLKHVRKVKFLNALRERFMEKYDPTWMELAGRNVLCRAIFNEIRHGRGTENGGILIDLAELPKEENERWRAEDLDPQAIDRLYEVLDEEQIDWKKPIEVAPSALHMAGGVRKNIRGGTNILGLFVVGEVSCGMHGAERLGGNCMAVEALVMGRRAGESAAKRALKASVPKIDWERVEEKRRQVFTPLERKEGTQPFDIRTRIQQLMYDKVGIIRNEEDLKEAVSYIQRLKDEAFNHLYVADKHTRYNSEWITAIEVLNMLDCAEVMARAALFRTESRAGHYREDYPKRDNKNWCVETGIRLVKRKIQIYKIPVKFTYLKPGEVGWPQDWLPWRYPKGIPHT